MKKSILIEENVHRILKAIVENIGGTFSDVVASLVAMWHLTSNLYHTFNLVDLGFYNFDKYADDIITKLKKRVRQDEEEARD